MFTVELYAKIRHAVMVDGLSRREAAKRFGVHRNTITKMLSFSVPPGYRRRERPASRELGPYMAWIDAILEGDRRVHKKQQHTAHRIFERLRDEQGFTGGYTIVPSSGSCASGFRRGGWVQRRQKGSLPLFLYGSAALGWLFRQGVSGRNGGGLRWPCRGIRFLRRRAEIGSVRQSMDASRARRSFWCRRRGMHESIRPVKSATRVSSLSLVRYKNNDYSAPTRYGHQEVLAKGYVDRVEIVRRDATIAVHPRSYETADFIYNPLHYLALLEQKTKALDQAAPLDNWRLADCVHRLRRLMEARMGTAGRREFIQVLRLMENFHQHQVEQAVSEALRLSAISFDAVKMLLLARLENRPARLDLTVYPYLPAATVGTTDPRAYLGLIAGQDSVSLAAGAQA